MSHSKWANIKHRKRRRIKKEAIISDVLKKYMLLLKKVGMILTQTLD